MTVTDLSAVLIEHGVTLPPTQDELPYDDGVPLETERHRLQIELLIDALGPWLAQRPHGGYAGGNMFVYFSMQLPVGASLLAKGAGGGKPPVREQARSYNRLKFRINY